MMNQRFLAAVFALSLSIALPTHAQILGTGVMPVTEIGPNLAQNSITATQSIITAAESVLQTANMVRELVPVDEIIVGKQIAEDLATLGEVLSNAEAVWYDLKSLDAQVTALLGWSMPRIRARGSAHAWLKLSSSTTARSPMPCGRKPS